jgi:hypothetical protein
MTETEQSRAAVELLARQDPIVVEIGEDGGMTLRQTDSVGNEAAIYIARANISAFLEALIDQKTRQRLFDRVAGPCASAESPRSNKKGNRSCFPSSS